ncbi:MAG: hypothetical protein KJ729_08390, partial [Euryarchaeota archaeon]|nr:hypothetical protein [Euryarchaeota archaeon]
LTKEQVVQGGRLFGDHILSYRMPWDHSVDIEEEKDFAFAETLLASKPRPQGTKGYHDVEQFYSPNTEKEGSP